MPLIFSFFIKSTENVDILAFFVFVFKKSLWSFSPASGKDPLNPQTGGEGQEAPCLQLCLLVGGSGNTDWRTGPTGNRGQKGANQVQQL